MKNKLEYNTYIRTYAYYSVHSPLRLFSDQYGTPLLPYTELHTFYIHYLQCVDFGEGGKPQYPEKNPQSIDETNFFSGERDNARTVCATVIKAVFH